MVSAPTTPSCVEHLLPDGVEPVPVELSVVVPTLNEQITVGEFVDWCKAGVAQAGVSSQILIVDSSIDDTPTIALQHGAEVLRTPKRGLGRAYIDALPYIRGKWVIMGDADLTYDFRELRVWVEHFRVGCEYIMGSRFKGSVEPGSMPALHRYFGTPLTTWLLNLVYGARFSDIHCGMRGATLDALRRMQLRSQSWQYASEMIIKSIHLRLQTSEVPVKFYKDRDGRLSHLKRIGWWAPWHAAWLSMQAMFVWGADFFLFKPGIVLAVVGTVGCVALSNGPITVSGIGFSLHWMFLFLVLALAGFQFTYLGVLAKTLYDPERKRAPRWLSLFGYNRAVALSGAAWLIGALCVWGLVSEYIRYGHKLPPQLGPESYRAVFGLGLLLWGVMHFTSTLLFHALLHTPNAPPAQP